MDGRQKPTDLMQTHFKFDFKICHALPLNDSVLIFHDNGIQVLVNLI